MIGKLRWTLAGILTAIVVGLFAFAIWFIIEIQPADRNSDQVISYQLPAGTAVDEIAQQMQDKDIIKNHVAFVIYTTLTGQRRKLQAGLYDLSPNLSTAEIASKISGGQVAQNTLVVPEGATVAQITELAADKGIPAKEFGAALNETYSNDFLAGRPSGDTSLEGYLFPDSYQVSKPPRPHALIQTMLNTFAEKVGAAKLPEAYAAEGISLHQGVTLASIVEKEVSNPDDQAMVAQVFINRIKAGMPLGSDVTILYAAKMTNQPFSVQLDSPYNTYLYKGLPPGPICNPGLSALQAVARPKANDYLYFLAGKDGKTYYAKTFPEHEANIKAHLK